MIGHLTYEGLKHQEDRVSIVKDELLVEQPLQICINNEPWTITMQTPGDEESLVVGLLYSEDILKDPRCIQDFTSHSNQDGVIQQVNVVVSTEHLRNGYMNSRQLLSVSSCGICGRTSFVGKEGQMERSQHLSPAMVNSNFRLLAQHQSLFAATGGCHGASAHDRNGDLLAYAEDIGRHNAVDKVIGKLLTLGNMRDAACLCVSGRVSYEIVAKCFTAGIPHLASVSAPSSLAVDFCKELGISLYAFCREERLTIYA
ncbi:MAG: hypothetical protein RL226_1799 [Bacteroidota bacterium]